MSSSLTPEECIKYLQEFKGDKPDFIQNNGAWLLTVIGVGSACLGTVFTYFLRSRCHKLKLGCMECDRTPVEMESVSATVTEV